MKKLLLILFTVFLTVYSQAQDRFTTFNAGTDFSTITVDGLNSRAWAGTLQNGVFRLDTDSETLATNFTLFNGNDPSGPALSSVNVKSIAADKLGNVWIGHQGLNFVGSQGSMERISSNLNVKHYRPETNFIGGISYNRNDGLGTLKINALTVDKNNTVWAAHHYRDLTSSPNYYLMPGVLAYKESNQTKFTTKGAWKNPSGTVATQPSELPYPAFTYNPPVSQTAQARVMDAISSDDTLIWLAVRGYLVKDNDNDDFNNPYIPNRILTYRLDGTSYTLGTAPYGGFSFTDMGFPAGGVINSICANNEKGTWASVSVAGRGFSVYKAGVWTHINSDTVDSDGGLFSNVLPTGTKFNNNAMWHDKIGRVFLGTDKGIIVYNGFGDPTKVNSYRLYSKTDFGAASGNTLNIVDNTMSSNIINGGSANPNNEAESWVATNNGIMRFYLPIEKTQMFNIEDYYNTAIPVDAGYPACIIHNDDDKLIPVKYLDNNLGNQYPETDASTFPSVAADGTNATLFRIRDFDPEGFYEPISKYKFVVGPGIVSDINDPDYIKRYGKFTVRTLSSYPNNSVSSVSDLNTLGYVDIIYTHPEFIDPSDYVTDEVFATFDFKIYSIDEVTGLPNEVFDHPLKVAVPPVLIGHGVWSDVGSLLAIEEFLDNQGFGSNSLIKAWRPEGAGGVAENTFMEDAGVIPQYIKDLKRQAAITDKLSAGKVNVVVHSRGGLYTRGYIEEINPVFPYKEDINALITLNTPHYGSQGGNFAVDKRQIPYGETQINSFIETLTDITDIPPIVLDPFPVSKLGQLVAGISDEEKVLVNGAFHLLVENDAISGVEVPEDPQFISKLNSDVYISKLAGVPIHTISTEFDLCSLNPVLCNNNQNVLLNGLSKRMKSLFILTKLFNFASNTLPNGINGVVQHLYDGETNDFIVPLTSMQANLGGTNYNTNFPSTPDHNYPHIDLPLSTAVTKAPAVLNRVLELFKLDVNDNTSNGQFKLDGLQHHKLNYNFIPFLDAASRNSNTITSKILINRDPAVFDNVFEGDILNYKVYIDDVDEVMLTYSFENGVNNLSIEIKDNLTFENDFSFQIPAGQSGELKITAYGFKNGQIGFIQNSVTLNIGIPIGVDLQGINFEQDSPSILNQSSFNYNVIGSFSDGIDRVINDFIDLSFTIEDTSIISQIDNRTIKGETVGSTLLAASINGFEDSILVNVQENQALYQTILTSFYGVPETNNTSIDILWETLREYENATFVLESSYNTPDNFTEVDQQPGNGTFSDPAQFNYIDSSFGSNTLIYYRLKMIDTFGGISYSSVIEIDLSSLSINDNNIIDFGLKLYPNPVNTSNVTLSLNSNLLDGNAKLELYSLQGKRVSLQTLNIAHGNNSFDLKLSKELANGIYLVRITTKGYVKTVKLVVDK